MTEIKAEVICDSISEEGKRITTYVLEYPRFVHAELMTHRMFSRNAASSRAIPVSKMEEIIGHSPAEPVYWGLNKAGMQANEEHDDPEMCRKIWGYCVDLLLTASKWLKAENLHKQIVNRFLEPAQMIKVIVTATEYANFFWLRCHGDAQPEIRVLAEKMYQAREESVPLVLDSGEWHLPYVGIVIKGTVCNGVPSEREDGDIRYKVNGEYVSLEQAKKYSAACCAAVSYRTENMSMEKAERIYSQLIESEPCHASPVEHQATPMGTYEGLYDNVSILYTTEGITHMDELGNLWSNNFQGWIQNRALIPNNVCNNYTKES